MSKVPAMSLGDIKRATIVKTPYEDLQTIIVAIYGALNAYLPLASKAHNMGLAPDDLIVTMSGFLVRDMTTFKERIDQAAKLATPQISNHEAMSLGSTLMSIQEDISTVLEPIAKDLITMYHDRGVN